MTNRQPSPVGQAVRSIFKWILMLLGTILLIGAATGAILACYAAGYIQSVILPEAQEEVEAKMTLVKSDTDLTSAIYYYDQTSNSFQVQEVLYASENRVWVSYEDIPQNLINATVAIEDKRFWTHGGVDWVRTASAMLHFVTGGRQEGGSTITQQLVKNVTQNKETTVKRKVLEIFEALEFNRTHSKEETLEWYLNIIFLGKASYGVNTAAQAYFGKELDELSLAECASLISITNNPSLYNPYVYPQNNYKRRCLVLDEMCEQGYITEEERDAAKAEKLKLVQSSADTAADETQSSQSQEGEDYYSWYTDTVIRDVINDLMETYGLEEKVATQMLYSGGLKIYSCLDPAVQTQVDKIYESGTILAGHTSNRGQDLQSAIAVIDNDSGAVVALAGGVGEKVGNRIWNMATQTLRPPGSAIKPLSVYAPALEMGAITPDSLLEDSPIRLSDGTLYPKTNSGKKPTGDMVTVTYGVEHSLNTIAVQVLQRVSPQYSFNFLQERFGITSLVEDYTTTSGKHKTDLDLAPLALGGLTYGISVYEMTAAYATFARDGIYVPPFVYTVVTDNEGNVVLSQDGYGISFDGAGNATITGYAEGEAVLKESTVRDMDEMLQNVVTNGTGKSAQIDGVTVAGKTGTTNDDYDRWFAGYTEEYTAAVWSGYKNSETINYDGNPSVDLWRAVMELLTTGGGE